MKTNEIIKTGIDRNFLRECERQKLISPNRIDSINIREKDYVPREYSQDDLEIVWNAYLYRKMGLSYNEIKQLNDGEEIRIRDSMTALIQKYENQIEELVLLIDFLKYVKGIGIIPSPPKSLMGSQSFKDYLSAFINQLDPDRKIKRYLSVAEYMAGMDFESVEEDKLDEMISTNNELFTNITEEDQISVGLAFVKLKDMLHLPPKNQEIQDVIHEIFNYQKKLENNPNLTAWDFASKYIYGMSLDSDIKAMLINWLGEDTLKYFEKALLEFLIIEEPAKINELRYQSKNKKGD